MFRVVWLVKGEKLYLICVEVTTTKKTKEDWMVSLNFIQK